MSAAAKPQQIQADQVEPKPSDIVQSVVSAVSAERGTRTLKGGKPQPIIGVLNCTDRDAGYRLVYSQSLGIDLIEAIASCLPKNERRIASARILDLSKGHKS